MKDNIHSNASAKTHFTSHAMIYIEMLKSEINTAIDGSLGGYQLSPADREKIECAVSGLHDAIVNSNFVLSSKARKAYEANIRYEHGLDEPDFKSFMSKITK